MRARVTLPDSAHSWCRRRSGCACDQRRPLLRHLRAASPWSAASLSVAFRSRSAHARSTCSWRWSNARASWSPSTSCSISCGPASSSRRTTCRCRSPPCASCSGRRRSPPFPAAAIASRWCARVGGARAPQRPSRASGADAGNANRRPETCSAGTADIDALGRSMLASTGLVTIVGAGGHRQDAARRGRGAAARRRVRRRHALGRARAAGRCDAGRSRPSRARSACAMGDAPASLERALQALASQRLLLVLDNCEHVLEAVDAFVTPLRRARPASTCSRPARSCCAIPTSTCTASARCAFPARTPTHRARHSSEPLARCSSSSRGHARVANDFALTARTSPAWSRSAAGSTASRSRSSSARRACRCSASTACGSASTSAFAC